jgi:hypothetical protein
MLGVRHLRGAACRKDPKALYFVFYNFARRHQSLRVSPAMAAGVSDRLWSMEDIVALIDAAEGEPKKRGPYKPRQPKSDAMISN